MSKRSIFTNHIRTYLCSNFAPLNICYKKDRWLILSAKYHIDIIGKLAIIKKPWGFSVFTNRVITSTSFKMLEFENLGHCKSFTDVSMDKACNMADHISDVCLVFCLNNSNRVLIYVNWLLLCNKLFDTADHDDHLRCTCASCLLFINMYLSIPTFLYIDKRYLGTIFENFQF